MSSSTAKPALPPHVFTPPTDIAGQTRALGAETVQWFSDNGLRIAIALAARR